MVATHAGVPPDRAKWWAAIDRPQVIACLLIAESKGRGITDIATAFERDPWLVPSSPIPPSG